MTPLSIEGVDIRDYKELLKRCNGNGCCKSSAKKLEKSKGYVLTKDQSFSCANGYRPNGLKCPDSYRWCEPIVND